MTRVSARIHQLAGAMLQVTMKYRNVMLSEFTPSTHRPRTLTIVRYTTELNRILRTAGIAPVGVRPDRFALAHGSGRGSGDETWSRDDLSARIGRVVVFVDDHLGEELSVERLADEAGLSKYHFSRRFREEVGESPWAYVRRARVERGKRLLERGASPAAAAVEAGFFDQSHFTNVMKDLAGKTPGQYLAGRGPRRRKDLQE